MRREYGIAREVFREWCNCIGPDFDIVVDQENERVASRFKAAIASRTEAAVRLVPYKTQCRRAARSPFPLSSSALRQFIYETSAAQPFDRFVDTAVINNDDFGSRI